MHVPMPPIPALYHRLLCEVVRRQGYDCRPWLASIGLSIEALQPSEATLTLSQVERLIAAIETHTGRQDWGFLVGQEIKLTSHGAVGFALVSGERVGQVLELAARYYRLTNPLYVMRVATHGELTTVRFTPATTLSPRLRVFYEECIAASFHAQMQPYLRQPLARYEIRMRHAAPAHNRFGELAQVRCRFGDPDESGVAIHVDSALLAQVNPLGDPSARTLAEEMLQRRVADLDKLSGWRNWVATALRTAENARPTQAELAALLHMSPRTLERALAREGFSFKEIYEQVGHERACELLDEGRHSVSEIAQRLGYSNIGAFSRAFKRRSGRSPTDYLAQRRQGRDGGLQAEASGN